MMRNHLTSLFLSFINGSPSDPIRLSWEAISARWFRGVWISGIVVAFGCALESWEVAFTLKNWWRHRKKRDALPDNPGSWRYPLAALGLFLVVGGIVSETVCEVVVSNAESQLRAHVSDQLSAAERDVGTANEEAANANGKAAEANGRTAKLLAEIQPRRLSPEQEKAIADAVRGYKGKVVGVGTYHEDAEAMILGIQIEEALRKAGIIVWDRSGTFTATGTPLYLGVVMDTDNPDKHLTSKLYRVLSEKGKLLTGCTSVAFGQGSTMFVPRAPKGVTGPKFVEDAFIFVGEKPIAEETWQNSAKQSSNPCAQK